MTHDQEEALAISDRIAVINQGRIEQIGKPEDIYKKPANEFVANFIGVSSFLPAQVQNGDIRIFDKYPTPVRVSSSYSGKAVLAVRPEHFVVGDPDANALAGTVVMATFLGDYVSYEIELENGLSIEANEYTKDGKTPRAIGDAIGITFSPEAVSVFSENGKERLQ